MKKIIVVQVQYDILKDQIILNAPMESQEEKNASIRALSTAISAVVAYKPSLILTPQGTPPPSPVVEPTVH